MHRNYYVIVWLVFVFCSMSQTLFAHEQSVAAIELRESDNETIINWQVNFKDIVRVVDLDTNSDQKIQWREVLSNKNQIQTLIESTFMIKSKDSVCSIELDNIGFVKANGKPKLDLSSKVACKNEIESLGYSFLKGLDRLHLARLTDTRSQANHRFVFNTRKNEYVFGLSAKSIGFSDFVYQGFIHIMIGLDHLAFLILLFFSAISIRHHRLTLKSIFSKKMLTFVTAFTLAHSITLIASSLNLVSLPSWLVESIIAASVGYGAIILFLASQRVLGSENNEDSRSVRGGYSTGIIFAFGLVHGLGFASVLSELSSDVSENVVLLLGFNLGVEIGQIIFLAVLALILYLPSQRWSTAMLCRLASAPLAVIACLWVIERSFDIELLLV